MRFVRITLRITLAVLVAFGLTAVMFARERGPRVEVACQSPPVPVRIDKQQVLVYELHITNFGSVPLKLTRIEVFENEPGGRAISTLTEDRLAAAMTPVGSKMGHPNASKDTQRIEPGGRAVVFSGLSFR